MSAFDFLSNLKPIPADRWSVSLDGAAKGPVTAHDVGVSELTAWVTFDFQADGQSHTIRGEVELSGSERVLLDSTEMVGGSIVLSNRVRGLSLRLVIEFKFSTNGTAHRYRFDGRVIG